MDFILQWLDTFPWYVRWLAITFLITFGVVFAKSFATFLAETTVSIIRGLLMLPVYGGRALFKKQRKKMPHTQTVDDADIKKTK